MKRNALLATIAVIGLALAGFLFAQEDAQPPPEATATAAVATPANETAPVEAAIAFDKVEDAAVEQRLTPAETESIADGAELDVDALASGEATMAEIGRDPGKQLDFGATWQVAVLLAILASLSPFVTAGLKRLGIVAGELAAGANQVFAVLFFLAAWWLLHNSYPKLPQDPLAWAGIALGGSGVGQAIRSAWVNLPDLLGRVFGKLGGKVKP